MPGARSPEVLLVFPPAMVDFLYPELGMCQVTGYLRSEGVRTEQRDINVEMVSHRLATRERMALVLDDPGWRRMMVGPEPVREDRPEALLERYRRDPPARRVLFLRLSSLIDLQPASMDIGEVLGWVDAPHAEHEGLLSDTLQDVVPSLLAGLSVCSATQIGPALKAARWLREAGCAHVVLGGPWARAARPMLGAWKDLFRYVDSIATGDGEPALADLARALREGRDPAGGRGIAVLRGGRIVDGGDAERIPLEDLAPADFGGLDLGRYENRWLPVRSRRSCPWGRCVFCHHVNAGEGEGETPLRPEHVVDRMEALSRLHGARTFEMANLSTPAVEMEAIATEILARRLDVEWISLVRIERGFDRSLLEKLARSGCVELQFGLESIADRDLSSINKGIRPEDVEALLAAAEEVPIRMNLFVLSFPGQRREDLVRTLEFCSENHERIHNFPLQRFSLSRGSGTFLRPETLGIEIEDRAARDLDVFAIPYTAREEVPFEEYVRIGTHHSVRFRKLKKEDPPTFWDVQGIVSRLTGTNPGIGGRRRGTRPLRLLLVRASLPGARLRGDEPPPVAPPLGVLYLSSAVKARSRLPHEVRVSDLGMDCTTPDEVLGLLAGHDPDVVGISANTVDEPTLHLVARYAKILDPSCTVLAGGAITTARGEDLLRDPFIDMIALHEGERTLPEVMDVIAEGGDPARVAGLVVRGPDGSPARTRRRGFEKDLDAIPFPDFAQIRLEDYGRLCNCNEFPMQARVYAPIFTSRGCPWRCIFCHNHFGRKARTRSAQNVLDEMEALVRDHGVGEFHVHDDIFNIDPDRLVEICDGIVERGLGIRLAFPNGVRADRLTRLHLEKLARAGCYHMCMALETVTPRLQRMIRKNLDVAKVLENASIASDLGIVTACFVMLGFPTETRAEMMATIDAVSESRFDYMRLFVACPHPSTEMYDLAVRSGFDPSRLSPERYEYDWDRTGVNLTDLADEEFRDLTQLCQERFLTHPARLERLRSIHERFGIPRKGRHLSHGVVVDL